MLTNPNLSMEIARQRQRDMQATAERHEAARQIPARARTSPHAPHLWQRPGRVYRAVIRLRAAARA